MRIRWSKLALADFLDTQDYIAADNPQSARLVAQRILDSVSKLRDFPYIGRPGDDGVTREWRVQQTPYLLVYRLHDDFVEITRVWHSRRDPGELIASTTSDRDDH